MYVLQLFSLKHRENVFKSYYALESHNLQTAYLCSLINVFKKIRTYKKDNPTRQEFSRTYFFPVQLDNINTENLKVCKEFFQHLFKISDRRITRALRSKIVGTTPPKDDRGKSAAVNKVLNEKRIEVINFIKRFPTSTLHYSRNKNLNKNYLSSNLNITIMYNLYKQEHNDPVSMYTFRQIFDRDFNLSFHPPVSDSCKKCNLFITQV